MTKRYFSGPSEAQAVLEAAAHFAVAPESIAYEAVSRKGSLRARTKSIIAVDDAAPLREVATESPTAAAAEEVAAPAAEESAAAAVEEVTAQATVDETAASASEAKDEEAPKEEAPKEETSAASSVTEAPSDEALATEKAAAASTSKVEAENVEPEKAPVDPQVVEAAVLSAVELLLDLSDLDVDPSVDVSQDPPRVNLSGPDREWLLDGEGDLLLALEHLVGRMLYRGGCPVDRVRVDSDGFREGQDEALRERTRRALVESRDTGRAVVFEPLGPAERRVIHLEVETLGQGWSRSEGSGFRRRVRIEATPEVTADTPPADASEPAGDAEAKA